MGHSLPVRTGVRPNLSTSSGSCSPKRALALLPPPPVPVPPPVLTPPVVVGAVVVVVVVGSGVGDDEDDEEEYPEEEEAFEDEEEDSTKNSGRKSSTPDDEEEELHSQVEEGPKIGSSALEVPAGQVSVKHNLRSNSMLVLGLSETVAWMLYNSPSMLL